VGKSTLINALVGTKVAITSDRPQTTRNVIRGVVHRPELQIVLVDTPGVHRPRTALGERLNERVVDSLAEADVALFLIDAMAPIGPGDRLVAGRLVEAKTPTVLVVNKIDAASDDEVIAQLGEAGEWDFAAYVPISAVDGTGLDAVVDEVAALLPEGPPYFPEDMVSDQSRRPRWSVRSSARSSCRACVRNFPTHSPWWSTTWTPKVISPVFMPGCSSSATARRGS
jgi:GTP-binding protein Era